MSKWDNQKGKGNNGFNMLAQAGSVAKTMRKEHVWMHSQGKLCWGCQKQSVPQKGCVLDISKGIHKYVCKECVNIRKTKETA